VDPQPDGGLAGEGLFSERRVAAPPLTFVLALDLDLCARASANPKGKVKGSAATRSSEATPSPATPTVVACTTSFRIEAGEGVPCSAAGSDCSLYGSSV
jgi:hypothetical protein